MRSLTLAVLPLVAHGAFLEAPALSSVRGASSSSRAPAGSMIIEQMKAAAKSVEGAAAEAIVQQKVNEKLAKAKEKYDIPEKWESVMGGFFTSYMANVYKAGNDVDHYEKVLTTLFKKVLDCTQKPYEFEPYHEAIREPFDYYALGCEFATGVINRDTSLIVGGDQIDAIRALTAKGDNVVLFANHQSEADPQIFSVLLDPEYPGFAEETIFVAGDRVTTDLLAQPFSMGRNLLCIFSKKHIENPPELKSQKARHNKNVMKQMKNLFTAGGKLIWVAPSGGRDRKDAATGDYAVAPFDSKSIEMFRLMAAKSGRTTHFVPLSMLTYNVCPPPDAVGGAIGEQRTVNWSPAALHFGEPVDCDAVVQAAVDAAPDDTDPKAAQEMARETLTEHIHQIVADNYKALAEQMKDKL